MRTPPVKKPAQQHDALYRAIDKFIVETVRLGFPTREELKRALNRLGDGVEPKALFIATEVSRRYSNSFKLDTALKASVKNTLGRGFKGPIEIVQVIKMRFDCNKAKHVYESTETTREAIEEFTQGLCRVGIDNEFQFWEHVAKRSYGTDEQYEGALVEFIVTQWISERPFDTIKELMR